MPIRACEICILGTTIASMFLPIKLPICITSTIEEYPSATPFAVTTRIRAFSVSPAFRARRLETTMVDAPVSMSIDTGMSLITPKARKFPD